MTFVRFPIQIGDRNGSPLVTERDQGAEGVCRGEFVYSRGIGSS
jgi:hypothetical protein